MATKEVNFETYHSGQTIFTTPKHVTGKITAVNIDNKGAENTVVIQDMFSGDVSNGVASPTVQSGVLVQYTVISGDHKTLKTEELGDIRTFGIVQAYGSVSGDLALVVGYKFE